MPDVDGKYYFIDYRNELRALGFDGYSDADLKTIVNRAYFHVARKSRWYWEQTTDAFTVAPGASYVDLWPTASGELPYFRSLDRLYCTTTNFRNRITVMNEDDFFQNWLSQDLTLASGRSEPSHYYIWQNKLYLLPPPRSSRDFVAHYHRRVAALVNDNDQPITPQHLDEAIMDGSKQRAHMRAQEVGLATLARQDLEEFFDDMRDDEEEIMDEQQDRVSPDDTWL